MLDAIKNLTGGKGKRLEEQLHALEAAISRAHVERVAISAAQTSLTARWAKLAPMAKSLEQVHEKASAVSTRLDTINARLEAIDNKSLELAEIDNRIRALKDAATRAEQSTQKAIGPDGELQRHREFVQQLASQALQTQASLEALRREQASLEEVRAQLRGAEAEIKKSVSQTAGLRSELDSIRTSSTSLAQDLNRSREGSREAKDDAAAALATVKEIDKKLGPLAQLQELSQSTEQRLTTLNALAEHVSHKIKSLEGQQTTVEHAVLHANRVSEMVWTMDAQVARINDGMKQVAQAGETLGKVEKLAQETAQQLEQATRLQQDTERDTKTLKRDTDSVLEAVRGHIETLSLKKHEFDAFDGRVQLLQTSVGDVESRMQSLADKDKHLAQVIERAANLFSRFDTMFARADELTQKQVQLESLRDRLTQVDELAK